MSAEENSPDEQIRRPETEQAEKPASRENRKPLMALCAAAALVTAALIWYSRTEAFAWDEGYHLVAAWLIAHGKTPYLDFVFPQTPVNAYWNALLLRAIGEDWRVPHTAAALLTAGAAVLAAAHVWRRFPAAPAWRAAAAMSTVVTFGLNTAVFEFGSLQAYGLCLFMIVAAYVLTVGAADRPGWWRPALAGLCCGIAADSSLLTAPVGPVLLVWLLIVNKAGSRVTKLAVFAGGVVLGFVPLLRLLVRSPHQVIFGFLQYQLLFRKVEWDGAGLHNLGEVLSWADSSQAVLLALLAAAGVVFIRRSAAAGAAPWGGSQNPGGECPPLASLRAEVFLCASLAVLTTVHLLIARPTFSRYWLLTVPFVSMAAATGLYEVTGRLATRPRPWLASGILCLITVYGLGASLFEEKDDLMWKDLEQTAAKIREVTPANASLLADETVYFLLRRTPPTGMELEDSHKLNFGDAEAAAVHVVPRHKLDLMIKAGAFDTVEMCDDDEIERIGLATLYGKTATAGTCKIFWSWGKK